MSIYAGSGACGRALPGEVARLAHAEYLRALYASLGDVTAERVDGETWVIKLDGQPVRGFGFTYAADATMGWWQWYLDEQGEFQDGPDEVGPDELYRELVAISGGTDTRRRHDDPELRAVQSAFHRRTEDQIVREVLQETAEELVEDTATLNYPRPVPVQVPWWVDRP